MSSCLVLGGGVVGLSIACELTERGWDVTLLERETLGNEASWAGAGILVPGSLESNDPHSRLCAISRTLHPQWSGKLRETTGIDNGYRACGAVYLATDDVEMQQLESRKAQWDRDKIRHQPLSGNELAECEPGLKNTQVLSAYYVAGEAQIRNPRHLKALQIACRNQGVTIHERTAASRFELRNNSISAVHAAGKRFSADQVVLATGAWSGLVLESLGLSLPIRPLRGQIAQLRCESPLQQKIVNVATRYLVPRSDGLVLVGSTEEESGFDKSNTSGGVSQLLQFANRLMPHLTDAQVVRTWAGLRPCTQDGLPYIGKIPQLSNGWVAAGHFRHGLQQSSATAVLLREMLSGETPQIDVTPYRIDR